MDALAIRSISKFFCCLRPKRNPSIKIETGEDKDQIEIKEFKEQTIKSVPFEKKREIDQDASYDIALTYGIGETKTGRRLSVSSQGSERLRKKSSSRKLSYYSIQGECSSRILLALFVSRVKKYVAGNIFEIDDVLGKEEGGPTKVKVHARILPSRRMILETDWAEVLSKKAFFMKEFKETISEINNEDEKLIRFRIYGDKKCLGECCVDLDEIEAGKETQRFWMQLVQKNGKSFYFSCHFWQKKSGIKAKNNGHQIFA